MCCVRIATKIKGCNIGAYIIFSELCRCKTSSKMFRKLLTVVFVGITLFVPNSDEPKISGEMGVSSVTIQKPNTDQVWYGRAIAELPHSVGKVSKVKP